MKCWTAPEPFDWEGQYWRGKSIVATPRPLSTPHMPMATATDTPAMIDLAAARGYTLLSAQLEPAAFLRRKADRYARAAKAAGRKRPLENITAARYVYLADSRARPGWICAPTSLTNSASRQNAAWIKMLRSNYDLQFRGR